MELRIAWRSGKEFPIPIKGGAMGLVAGIPVYICGMTYPWRETEQGWYWDEDSGEWLPVEPSIPLGRCYTQGLPLEEGMLVLGGRKSTPAGRTSLDDAWWLRRQDGAFAWTRLPDMNYGRAIASIGVAKHKILALGGGEWEKSQGGAFATRHLKNYEILDLRNLDAGWRDMGPLPFKPLVGSACASIDDALYLFGGYECWTEGGQRRIAQSASAWRYGFATNAWTRLADCPVTASGWCGAAYQESVILLGGGLTFDLGGVRSPYHTLHTLEPGTSRQRLIGAYSDLALAYDTRTDSYQVLPDRMPVGLNDLRCAIAGRSIYTVGGESVDPALSNTINSVMIGTIA